MLRLTLAINDDPIADYEIKRVTGLGRMPGPDDVNDYEVRSILTGRLALPHPVKHRYGDGARRLAAYVLNMLAVRS